MDLSASNLFLIKKILNAQSKPIVYEPTIFRSDLRAYVTLGSESMERYTDTFRGLQIVDDSQGAVNTTVTQYGYRYYDARLTYGGVNVTYKPVVLDKSGKVTHPALLDDTVSVYTTENDEPLTFRRYGSPGTFYFIVGWYFIASTTDGSGISNDDTLNRYVPYRNISHSNMNLLNGSFNDQYFGSDDKVVHTATNMFITEPDDILNRTKKCSALSGTVLTGTASHDIAVYTCLIPMPLIATNYSVKYNFKKVS